MNNIESDVLQVKILRHGNFNYWAVKAKDKDYEDYRSGYIHTSTAENFRLDTIREISKAMLEIKGDYTHFYSHNKDYIEEISESTGLEFKECSLTYKDYNKMKSIITETEVKLLKGFFVSCDASMNVYSSISGCASVLSYPNENINSFYTKAIKVKKGSILEGEIYAILLSFTKAIRMHPILEREKYLLKFTLTHETLLMLFIMRVEYLKELFIIMSVEFENF